MVTPAVIPQAFSEELVRHILNRQFEGDYPKMPTLRRELTVKRRQQGEGH